MKLPDYIHFTVAGEATYILQTVFPYTLGKVQKHLNQAQAQDFDAKLVTYPIIKIPGYNIFIIHAGYLTISGANESFRVKEEHIKEMADYYLEDVVRDNKIIMKRYKTNWA
jgi:hypothetical protein